MNGDPVTPLTKETKSCPRCDGRGRIEPFWPVGPGGARLDDHKCSTCGGTGIVTISPPVMNSPADEAEARDRAHGAPRQADPAAPGRGESGLTSGSEARPVTPTARHLSSKKESPIVFNLRQIAASDIARWDIRNHIVAAAEEVERLTRENATLRSVCALWGLHEDPQHEDNVARAALSAESGHAHETKPEPDVGALNRQLCEAEGHVFSRFAMHHCLRCEAAVTPGGYLAYTSSQKANRE